MSCKNIYCKSPDACSTPKSCALAQFAKDRNIEVKVITPSKVDVRDFLGLPSFKENPPSSKKCICPFLEMMKHGCDCGAIQRYKPLI